MNFFAKHKVGLLFGAAVIILLGAVFWPDAKKPGEMQKYYSFPQAQLVSIEYTGEMSFGDKAKVQIAYAIHREENIVKPKEPLYRVEIKSLTTSDARLTKRVAELSKVRNFYASALMRTIAQDWSEPEFYYALKHEPERDAEYGIQGCLNRLTVNFRSSKKEFCIGTSSQGDSRRYLLDTVKDKLVITPDFTVRRLLNNIFAQREQSLHPYGSDGADAIDIKLGPEMLKKFPILAEKTGGVLKLRRLIKDEGKNQIQVWHVDGLLTIKPSHAAEFAQLLAALRINAPFAVDAQKSDRPLGETLAGAGVGPAAGAGLTGNIKIRKTDKQDVLLTAFAFFPPGTKPIVQPGWQFDNQLIRPTDTVLLSHFNSGFITADLYPRLTGIFAKYETDLREAQKKGEQEKTEKLKKEGEQKSKGMLPKK